MAARVLAFLLLLAAAAAAIEPVYRVDADVLYLPSAGLALNARTGQVAWRYPRFTGQTYTDGHGLLLVAWEDLVQPLMGTSYTRVCRLRTGDGHQLWCREWPGLDAWDVDGGGQVWYELEGGRLRVIASATGNALSNFKLPAGASLMVLPGTGVLLLVRDHRGHAIAAWSFVPGTQALHPENLPPSLYTFRGNGRGLLLYAREKGDFFLAAPLRALFTHAHTAAGAFPAVSLDGHGFVLTDSVGDQPVVRGGTFEGALWQAPRPDGDPELGLSESAALLLQPGPGATSSQLTAWDLASGHERFSHSFDGNYPLVNCAGDDVLLQSQSDVRLVSALDGNQLWISRHHQGPLAVISATSVVFWEGVGQLLALARDNGAPLWRINFVEPTSSLGTVPSAAMP